MSNSNITILNTATMSSREIADLTEKKHGHVIRDIEKMLNDIGEPLSKFGSSYLAGNGKQEKEYQLPKREALILTSGYSVTQRTAIIDRWLALEGDYNSMSECEQMLWHAQRLVDQERRVKTLEVQQVETKAQLTALVNGEDFFTVVGFAHLHDVRIDQKETSRIGKIATKVCKEHGWHTGTAPHPMYGKVNTYPSEALETAFSTYSNEVAE